MAGSAAHVTAADAQRAQDLLDAWVEEGDKTWTTRGGGLELDTYPGPALLELRGLLTVLLADVRDAAHLEGVIRGRREVAHVVLDALEAEGLFTTTTRQGEGL